MASGTSSGRGSSAICPAKHPEDATKGAAGTVDGHNPATPVGEG